MKRGMWYAAGAYIAWGLLPIFWRSLEVGDDFSCDAGGHGRAAFMHFFDGGDEFGAAGALQEIAAGSGAEAVEDGVAVVVGGEHEHLQDPNERLCPKPLQSPQLRKGPRSAIAPPE